jgi:spermidine synthase
LSVIRATYIALGGTRALGFAGGSAVRLFLAAIVVALPAVLMGGTLPAAARAIERPADRGRRASALLYGANTLGAFAGSMVSTFILLQAWGNRLTLWSACVANGIVALIALRLARTMPAPDPERAPSAPAREAAVPIGFTLGAAAASGFVFCLLELVWYRMLAPLLGGTVHGFGLVLAVALLGVGLGGAAYAARPRMRRPTVLAFAWTCALEALFVAFPYALGDRLAILAILLRPLDGSFAGRVAGWALVTGIIALPASLASGVQFPLLVGLLGEGDQRVGRHVGLTYATNTLGAMAGSLSGGFVLIPALTAPGCWRLAVGLLLALCAVAIVLSAVGPGSARAGERRNRWAWIPPATLGLAALGCTRADGPTAAWRHSPIGAGRVDADTIRGQNRTREWEHYRRRITAWEADGIESSIAISHESAIAFLNNGKSDGNARSDAATQVMFGLLGALFAPDPKRAMVIGLGTGETAGWLAAVDSISDVDVAELEPAVLEVARRCESINHRALQNPKVHVDIGDARELLATADQRYDVIASEPSNPYRAGVASLLTREYYETVASRLEDDGVFVQWLQAYEIDAQAVRVMYATLASIFPQVQTWQLARPDLAFVAFKRPIAPDLLRARERMSEEPYRTALARAWRVTDFEGFLAHFVANSDFARRMAAEEDRRGRRCNTDDRNVIEFSLAQSVGSAGLNVGDLRRDTRLHNEHRPAIPSGVTVDWERVDDGMAELDLADMVPAKYPDAQSTEHGHRLAALRAMEAGNWQLALHEWRAQPREPKGPTETALMAIALAELGDDAALTHADALASYDPLERDAIAAHLRFRQARIDDATTALEALFVGLRQNPWPMPRLLAIALGDARAISLHEASAPRVYAMMREPFALHLLEDSRKDLAFGSALLAPGQACVDALAAYEPNVPWEGSFLALRAICYRDARHPMARRAAADREAWQPVGGP